MFMFNNCQLFRVRQRLFSCHTRYQTNHFLIKLFGNTVLDSIVLGYDPLVMMLVRASGKRARKFRFSFRGVSGARNESQHPFPEMFFNEMLVKVKGCDANKLDVVTHEALQLFCRLSILVSRVLKMKAKVDKFCR